jgi:poly(A) polymerase
MENKYMTNFEHLNKFIKKINNLSHGFDVYAVGGFTRDLLLKRKYSDIDLIVNKDSLKYSQKIAKAFRAKFFVLNDINKTYRIILSNNIVANIDISLLDGKTIKEDLQNRDFTINAIAFKLKNFQNFKKFIVLPNKNALNDLILKTINTVSTKSFQSDPLRMLRAFRFVAELNFKLSNKTLQEIKQNVKLINKTTPERIKNEIFRVLFVKKATSVLEKMDKCGLFSEIFPEIKVMKKTCKKYYYHPGGLFQHSFETTKSTENILNNLKKYFPTIYLDIKEHLEDNTSLSENITRVGLLKFVALFHDNAKPETAKFKNGKIHFLGHEKKGAEKIREIMLHFKLGKKDIEIATFLIKNHMRPSVLTKNILISKRASLRFFRDIGDNTPDLLVISMSDWYSYKKLKIFSTKELKFQEKLVNELLIYYYKLKNSKPLPKIIDGNLIMREFNLKPGPWIGELLNLTIKAQQEGKIFSNDKALELISSKLIHIKKKYRIH